MIFRAMRFDESSTGVTVGAVKIKDGEKRMNRQRRRRGTASEGRESSGECGVLSVFQREETDQLSQMLLTGQSK